jgi:uncharacterized protein YggE
MKPKRVVAALLAPALIQAAPAGTSTIDPGGRKITATVSVVFELE